ncbi:hypothetical protein L6164_032393 [Bauhinia variegata]|uniref:Uncharacterized protein n=1 Tax=Bauhinia variegata TaxID=167791 RepID=A0ACB9KNI4_BAUVA|nr:hypothetical protein L6164_032393 [Bauhinia variegata]
MEFSGPSPSFPFRNIQEMKKKDDIMITDSSLGSSNLTHNVHYTVFPNFSRWQRIHMGKCCLLDWHRAISVHCRPGEETGLAQSFCPLNLKNCNFLATLLGSLKFLRELIWIGSMESPVAEPFQDRDSSSFALIKTTRHGAKTHDEEGRLRFHLQSFVSCGAASKTIVALWRTKLLTPEQKAQIAEDQEDQEDFLIPGKSGMSIILCRTSNQGSIWFWGKLEVGMSRGYLLNSKPCPKCKRPMEKNQDHGERTGGFYACNRYEAAELGVCDEAERRREMAKNSLER